MKIDNILQKKITFDIFLNMISSAFPVFILQYLIYPNIAKNIGANKYGLFLVIIGYCTMFSNIFGSSINNTRLLLNNKNSKDDGYNILLAIDIIISSILIFIIIFFIFNSSLKESIACIFIVIIGLSMQYLSAEYRININYRKIFISQAFISIGYLIGFYLYLKTNFILYIPLIGNLLCFVYEIITTNFFFFAYPKIKIPCPPTNFFLVHTQK
jgi:hypothetical protein